MFHLQLKLYSFTSKLFWITKGMRESALWARALLAIDSPCFETNKWRFTALGEGLAAVVYTCQQNVTGWLQWSSTPNMNMAISVSKTTLWVQAWLGNGTHLFNRKINKKVSWKGKSKKMIWWLLYHTLCTNTFNTHLTLEAQICNYCYLNYI